MYLIHHFLERSAGRLPDKVAWIRGEESYTYGEIDGAANELAGYLGCVLPDEVRNVVLCLDNCIEYVIGYYGILKAGRVAVPLNPGLAGPALRDILGSVAPFAAICTPDRKDLRDLLAAHRVGPSRVICVGSGSGNSPGTPWSEAVCGHFCPAPEPVAAPDDLASIIFTSGSTGRPKGVMLSHRNIVHNTGSICRYLDIREQDRQLVVLPFYYVMGKTLLNSHFAAGATLILSSMTFPARAVQTMVEQEVTSFSGVPPTYATLLHRSPFRDHRDRLPALRYCSQAGGHMTRSLKREFLAAKPDHTDLVVMYGATEAAPRVSFVPPDMLRSKLGSIGIPIPGVTLRVMGEGDAVLGPDTPGEITVQGENVMQGYWNDPETSARVLGPYGYRTGDYGYYDRDGYFYVTGRKDDQVKVRGHRVSTQEVEDLLMEAVRCVECCVLALPAEDGTHRLHAVLVPGSGGCTEQTAKAACATQAPPHLIPDRILILDTLPKMGSGKIDRGKCKKVLSVKG
jgi:acyl-CoA synthetase (AMP-forming)/AMP-acid ligase II